MGIIDLLKDMVLTIFVIFSFLLGMYICTKAIRDVNKFLKNK